MVRLKDKAGGDYISEVDGGSMVDVRRGETNYGVDTMVTGILFLS